MKKLWFGLLVFGSASAQANCTVSISQWGVNGEHLSDAYVANQVGNALADSEYTVIEDSNADYNMHLHYYGMLTTKGSKTIGTVLTFSQNRDGQKVKIAEAKNEKFAGSARMISKKTLMQNLSEIAQSIPHCP